MFTAKQIRELMTAKSFRPFRIHMTDGSAHEVINHDSAFVLANCVEIGLEPNQEGFAQRTIRCAYLHISRIEELQPA